MNKDWIIKTWDELIELGRRVGHKFTQLSQQARSDTDLRRLSVCCAALLLIVGVLNPPLGIASLLGTGLYLSK